MSSYDTHYLKLDYFGKAYPELMEFFDSFERTNTILDIGCGQGRDALELGRMGFFVKGFDISTVGINQMNRTSVEEDLNVVGETNDYKSFSDFCSYDFILMNSMFHFYKNDIEEESNEINRILNLMKVKSRLVLVFQESKFRIKHIKALVKSSKLSLTIDFEQSIIYKEFSSKFYIISILKC